MSTGVTYQYLESRPKSAYSQLFIKGTRIRAELIYRAHINAEEPMTPEELAIDYGLPLPAIVEAGLKDCFVHYVPTPAGRDFILV